jgi:hypothetical protein
MNLPALGGEVFVIRTTGCALPNQSSPGQGKQRKAQHFHEEKQP